MKARVPSIGSTTKLRCAEAAPVVLGFLRQPAVVGRAAQQIGAQDAVDGDIGLGHRAVVGLRPDLGVGAEMARAISPAVRAASIRRARSASGPGNRQSFDAQRRDDTAQMKARASLAGVIVHQHVAQVAGHGAFVHRDRQSRRFRPRSRTRRGNSPRWSRIDRRPDHRRDQEAGPHLRQERIERLIALCQRNVVTEGDGGPPVPRAAFAVEAAPACARWRGRGRPSRQDAVGHDIPARGPQPFGIEGARAADAGRSGSSVRLSPFGRTCSPQKVARPGRAAGDGTAIGGGQQMPDQPEEMRS
jgi:hypothetical protein